MVTGNGAYEEKERQLQSFTWQDDVNAVAVKAWQRA